MEWLQEVFGLVCGRRHVWALGGVDLPFCQRCTGLYVGAALAMVLYAAFRPRPTYVSLGAHGLLLLVMVPFGYHLVPQNAVLRTLTGQLFSVGLVSYLSLLPASRLGLFEKEDKGSSWAYAAGVLASLVILQAAVHTGGRPAGVVLAWLGFLGLLALAALVTANLALLPGAIWRGTRPFS
ncbi:MAG: hypothetical protein A2V98_21520 [Planctomycetes bacterium RBG_16_64_12]|nr:MAG: hypothetical protein A2V98_21520 [Planctomycetes bacterium RBG_16_64_12]